jgi:hypothetical protein
MKLEAGERELGLPDDLPWIGAEGLIRRSAKGDIVEVEGDPAADPRKVDPEDNKFRAWAAESVTARDQAHYTQAKAATVKQARGRLERLLVVRSMIRSLVTGFQTNGHNKSAAVMNAADELEVSDSTAWRTLEVTEAPPFDKKRTLAAALGSLWIAERSNNLPAARLLRRWVRYLQG